MEPKHIVPKKWLLARLYEPDLKIVDCRFQLNDPAAGKRNWKLERIPGAVYFDLEQDMSGPVGEHGGRHPLPDLEPFARKLGQAGIGPSSRVVAYDDQGGAMASRLWWLLKYVGHEQVYVLDEGFTAWREAGYPVSSDAPPVTVPERFVPRPQPSMLADVHDVRTISKAIKAGSRSQLLIDAREQDRYLGRNEPIDHIAGHIPGAVNRFWKENVDERGRWHDRDRLAARFADADGKDDVIVYCGSGVTACPNVLALHAAGYEQVKLYVGSWSDWISYEENPIATGEE